MTPRGVFFLFLDGVGLGPVGPHNPLSTSRWPGLDALAGGQPWIAPLRPVSEPQHTVRAIDANLGLEGLPQSGTGQATMLTGHNCARIHGAHYGPFPPTTVRETVRSESVFARLVRAGVPASALAFANAYPERFFRAMETRPRWTATSLAALGAGVRLRTATDLAEGRALPADLTGERWHRYLDAAHQPVSPAVAAQQLSALASRHRFTLFDYPYTDKAGHGRDGLSPADVLPTLDAVATALLPLVRDAGLLLLVTSDHGNIEATDTKSHTRNPVPLIAIGPGADQFTDAQSLVDLAEPLAALASGRA